MSETDKNTLTNSRPFLLDETKDVYKHPVFLLLVLVPALISITLIILVSCDYRLSLDVDGFDTFLAISKLPIGILSLSLLLGVMFYRIHASKQKTKILNDSIDRDRFNKNAGRDEVYVELIRNSFDSVYELLKDRSNDNVIWIRAARLLLESVNLKTEIVTPAMKKSAELLSTQLRAKLYDVLTLLSEGIDSRQSLPPQFFYGIQDWETETSLDEAARKSSGSIKTYQDKIDSVTPPPRSTSINTKAVRAIYDFLAFPNDYCDPLDKVSEWTDNWNDSHGYIQGAKRYCNHRENHTVIGGTLRKRNETK